MWLLLLIAFFVTGPESDSVERFTVYDFSDAEHVGWWYITDDDVMGGVSQGQWEYEGDFAVFSGNVSLDNNGGFSSVRTSFRPVDMGALDGIELKVRGDGQLYSFNLRDTHSWNSHRLMFMTEELKPGEWQIIRIPFRDLIPTRFGRILPNANKIDLGLVKAMSILISDKQEGEFRLEIAEIRVYGIREDQSIRHILENDPNL